MDVTPQLIEQIDFSEKFRGYDPDQVDDFLERVGATIAELNNAVREANERAERADAAAREAMSQAPSAPLSPAVMTDEEAATTAARTLMLAQRTADSLIAEAQADIDSAGAEAGLARETAAREGRIEADRLVGEARIAADAILRTAQVDAERELVARRDTLVQEIGELELRKQALAADATAIEQRVDEYRGSLDRVHGAIRTILDDPEALRQRPPLDVDMTATPVPDAVVEATAHESAAQPTPDVPLTPFGADVEFDHDDVAGSDIGHQSGATVAIETDVGAAFEADLPGDREPASLDFDPVPGEGGTIETIETGDVAPADPWGPGSWSDVIADATGPADAALARGHVEMVPGEARPSPALAYSDEAFSGAAFADPVASVPVTAFVPVGPESAFGSPTGAYATAGQDRYLRDLDEAVNQTGTTPDDRMTAFFEGDVAEEEQHRRFRRR